ncbi:LysR family transcriptional regulator [Denitrificimonas caeni]|uniref:LysR family transcriptional regulator n=1 Tax=Denitrificimonas caeni TaxID=521720 RepID=UPI001964235B|nr:LysR family transcriptional regulator [Denitrificimonas caeni]
MQITLRQLQIFTAVALSGSTAAAAQSIALSQSATSAALKELENMLSIELFDRVGKRLVLNDNGRLLLPQARQMLDAANTIEQQFSSPDTPGSGLYIGASTTIGIYLLPTLLATQATPSKQRNPRVMIANSAATAAAVAHFEVDIGLIEGPCHEPDLVVEPWLDDELVIVCAALHPILQGDPQRKVPLSDLQNALWLLREPGSGTQEAVEHVLLPHLHQLRSAVELSNSEAIKHAAAAGLGLACLSRAIVSRLLDSGELVELSTTLPELTRRFFLIYHRNKTLSPQLNAFLNHCRQMTHA